MSDGDDKDKLWYYVRTKDIEEVTLLLEKKKYSEIKKICETEVNKIVWPKEQNHRDSLSCFHYAAKKGRFEIIKELFHLQGEEKNALDIDLQTSILGWTPLHYAAHGGCFQTMLFLIRSGALVNPEAKDGTTPLHVSVFRCMRHVTVGLVNCGANVNLTDERGFTPLHICVESLKNDLCTQLECKEMIEFLLTRGCIPNVLSNTNELALHYAIRCRASPSIIKLLASSLKRFGADTINIKDSMGYAAIHQCKSADNAQMLVNYGANINLQTDVEETSLLHTSTTDLNLVTFIITAGGDKMLKDNEGEIPLHHAVRQQCPNLEVIKLLSSDYKHVVAVDNYGDTALHKACVNRYKSILCKDDEGVIKEKHLKRGEDPILDLLITERGANIDEKNKLGQTPLHKTVQARDLQKATILVMYGADMDVLDHKNLTPRKMDPSWAKRAQASLEFSDLDSVFSGSTGRKTDSLGSNETSSTTLTNSKPVTIPKWVKDTSKTGNHKNTNSEKALNREMTLLKNEVNDVRNFLEEFSKEGEKAPKPTSNYPNKTSSKAKEPGKLDRQLTRLHDEVNDLNKMLQDVAG